MLTLDSRTGQMRVLRFLLRKTFSKNLLKNKKKPEEKKLDINQEIDEKKLIVSSTVSLSAAGKIVSR